MSRIEHLDRLPCFSFYLGWRLVRDYYQSVCPAGLSLQRAYVLGLCARGQGVTVSDLARALWLDRPSVSGLVERMVADGLLVRWRSKRDRRRVHLLPSAHGKRQLEVADASLAAADRRLAELVGSEPLQQVRELVEALRQARIETDLPGRGPPR